MNRVALVTGSSRGIGRGIANALAKLGFNVIINYAGNAEAAAQTAEQCIESAGSEGKSITAEVFKADISNSDDRRRLIEFTYDRFNRLDLLVNNAGVAPRPRADILEANEESFDRMIHINLKGPYFLTQSAANKMIEHLHNPPANPPYNPKIITISSVSAYAASVNRGDYCITKSGLSMLTQLFAARLSEFGIGVFEIRPGIIATDMTAPVKERYDKLIAEGLYPIKRWGTPDDVGRAVCAVADDLLPFSTGEVINVDGGFHMRTL
ncbi:MAG: 3-ketoacyl-ACP reductase [Verrucomicrobia bacterium]|nr:3-ketoacyl-ACP reductase [Verrucomicrobiota bacterium]MCF7707978.1 3-ketoacyl-ACP reductase [Verrucomicrobiota bacterium]